MCRKDVKIKCMAFQNVVKYIIIISYQNVTQKTLFSKTISTDISNGMVSTDLVAGLGRDARGWCGSVLPLSGSPGMAASVSFLFPSSCSGLLCAQWHP